MAHTTPAMADVLHVCIVGTGYVGLVSGACLASFGHRVVCVDHDAARIAQLDSGQSPFFEPGLADLVAAGKAAGAAGAPRLRFSTQLDDAVAHADLVLIAVGTPLAADGGQVDLSQVFAAAEAAALAMRSGSVLVIKSTVPVGTCDSVAQRVAHWRPDASIAVASNPEFLREGKAIEDFCRPARVVIGGDELSTSLRVQQLYEPLRDQGVPFVITSRRTAELIKYAANSFLATKLAFINEMADLCERLDADIEDVACGMGLDPRIGMQYLRPGPGYGGSCLPKDLVALGRTARESGAPLRIVETVTTLNEGRAGAMVDKVRRACGGQLQGLTVGLLGVAFKPDTDDVRTAPALALVAALRAGGATVRLTDPKALHHARALFSDVACVDDPYECAQDCDAIVIVTDWPAYRALDLSRVRAGLRTPILVDLRNLYRPEAVRAAGLAYTGVGRGSDPCTPRP